MARFLILLCLVLPISAHICLITPQQRGKIDISTSGSHTCFKHGFPCGGDPPVTPKYLFIAGQPAFIKWQQNYNHYEPGFPGYMDIAIGPIHSKSPDDWTTLGVVSDKYVFSQDYQRNYTAIVNIPNKTCDYCVLRVRYNAHKPGESTFYQCSDISVLSGSHNATSVSSSSPLNFPLTDAKDGPLQKAIKLTNDQSTINALPKAASTPQIYGQAFDPFNTTRLTYVQVDPTTGTKININKWGFGLAASENLVAENAKYITEEVLTVDPSRQSVVSMFHTEASRDSVPDQLIEFSLYNGTIINQVPLSPTPSAAINSMVYMAPGQYLTFTIKEESTAPGNYYFVVGQLEVSGKWKQLGMAPQTENLFINFQWMVYDTKKSILYVLVGNENAADSLATRIYPFKITADTASFAGYITLDVSTTTFMSMHYYSSSVNNGIIAISPGLFSAKYPAYKLIKIDLTNGNVKQLLDLTPPGIFEKYYGGTVINGLDQNTQKLYHVFKVADSEADVIATIDLKTLSIKFSQMTNLRHIHNLVYGPGK